MKSVALITLEYPPQVGGIATYLSRLAECFPHGTVHALAPEDRRREKDVHLYDVSSEIPIYRRGLLGRFIRPRWLPALYWADWLWRKEKPSIFLVSHLLPMGTVARIMKKRRGVPYAVIVHGMDVALAMEARGKKFAEAKLVLAEAKLVVANSAYTAGLVSGLGVPKEKLVIVRPSPHFAPDTVVPAEKSAELRARFGVAFDDFLVLTAGRLVARKGFSTAIEAVALLKERGNGDVKLLVVGDGPERKALEKLAGDKNVTDRVRFAGALADADMPAAFAACEAFAMAPKSAGADVEGFGIVYLEANALGKPVIGSRAGGVPDAVIDGKTGLLVEPGNAKELADAIDRLRTDQALRERLGAEGQRRVRDEFGWKRQARPLIEALLND